MRQIALWAAMVLAFGTTPVAENLAAQNRFPHQRHSVFFSDCSACHDGMTSGVEADAYPELATCSACHDGTTAPDIQWERPGPRASNVIFPHQRHDFGCSFCHQPGGEEDLTNLVVPEAELCQGCHAPEAEGHFEATGECRTCHVPIVESRLTEEAITDIPAPGSHSSGDFSRRHGPLAAEAPADCSVCHDRNTCFTCHGGATHLPDAVLALPVPLEDGPVGIQIPGGGSGGFHPADFVTAHAVTVSTGTLECSSCHSENSCVECHDAPGSPGFHPMNFLASHGPEAFGRMSDCTSCHTSEGFCRECHLNLGMGGGGELVAPFHDGEGLWILSHPQAARQGLESCVTCHRQNDCLRCHSAGSGLRISPHGPDFDPSRIAGRNQASCILCHVSGLGGGH